MSYEATPQRRFEQQEILDIFSRFVEGAELEPGRLKEDEGGLYLLHATKIQEVGRILNRFQIC